MQTTMSRSLALIFYQKCNITSQIVQFSQKLIFVLGNIKQNSPNDEFIEISLRK